MLGEGFLDRIEHGKKESRQTWARTLHHEIVYLSNAAQLNIGHEFLCTLPSGPIILVNHDCIIFLFPREASSRDHDDLCNDLQASISIMKNSTAPWHTYRSRLHFLSSNKSLMCFRQARSFVRPWRFEASSRYSTIHTGNPSSSSFPSPSPDVFSCSIPGSSILCITAWRSNGSWCLNEPPESGEVSRYVPRNVM